MKAVFELGWILKMIRFLTRSGAVLLRGAAGRAAPMSTAVSVSQAKDLNKRLEEADPVLFDIIENEKVRQRDQLNLIASENYASRSVLDALGSVMQNKYSEGYPGARYVMGVVWVGPRDMGRVRSVGGPSTLPIKRHSLRTFC